MDYVAGFRIGTHVVIERSDDGSGIVAGILLGEDDDGYFVNVTHRTQKFAPELLPEQWDEIRAGVSKLSDRRLKITGVLSGHLAVRKMGREKLIDATTERIVARIQEEHGPVENMVALLSPVQTYMSKTSVWTMEHTTEKNDNAVLENLNASL